MDQDQLTLAALSRQGYCCAQLPMLLELKAREEEEPGLVRALASFCYGQPGGEGPCGALSGGLALLGWYGSGAADSRLTLWLEELTDWFTEAHGQAGLKCADILNGGPPSMSGCGLMVLAVYRRTIEILSRDGVRV